MRAYSFYCHNEQNKSSSNSFSTVKTSKTFDFLCEFLLFLS